MSTSSDVNHEHELSQEDAREAVKTLRNEVLAYEPGDPEGEALVRVAMALEAFAAGSTNIVPEE